MCISVIIHSGGTQRNIRWSSVRREINGAQQRLGVYIYFIYIYCLHAALNMAVVC